MDARRRMQRLVAHLGLWTVVCCIAAAPSLYFGLFATADDPVHITAMVLGVVIYIVGYTAASLSTAGSRLRRRVYVRRAMYVGYGLRVLPALGLVAFGWLQVDVLRALVMPDLYCGLAAMYMVESVYGGADVLFVGYLATTLLQGLFLNIIIGVVVLAVIGTQRLVLGPEASRRRFGLCAACGYDLRASSNECPECGTPIVPLSTAVRGITGIRV